MTSTHPPVWWKAPLGPLTTGRDLCGVLREALYRAGHRDAVRPGVRGEGHPCLRAEDLVCLHDRRGRDVRLSLQRTARAPLYLARPARRHAGHEPLRR